MPNSTAPNVVLSGNDDKTDKDECEISVKDEAQSEDKAASESSDGAASENEDKVESEATSEPEVKTKETQDTVPEKNETDKPESKDFKNFVFNLKLPGIQDTIEITVSEIGYLLNYYYYYS